MQDRWNGVVATDHAAREYSVRELFGDEFWSSISAVAGVQDYDVMWLAGESPCQEHFLKVHILVISATTFIIYLRSCICIASTEIRAKLRRPSTQVKS